MTCSVPKVQCLTQPPPSHSPSVPARFVICISPQLPQYCADDARLNKGLVICTQPRALAAVQISKRIADEYDGDEVGENVGFSVGGNETPGRRIALMTDASLVRMLRHDPLLSAVSVLMIDEAHERSLCTCACVCVDLRVFVCA